MLNPKVSVKVCEAGLVRCVGEIVRGGQVIAFVHMNPFNIEYSIESARTGKIQHWFGSMELLQEFCDKERVRLDLHVRVESITLVAAGTSW